jgi:hypothetical protein
MSKLTAVMLTIVGVIHLLPLSGALSAARLAALYGLGFDEPNLAILMRHRAVLFGMLGVFLIYAGRAPALQPVALVAGILSVTSFLWLAWSVGGYNPLIARVIAVDLVALGCLLVGGVAFTMTS